MPNGQPDEFVANDTLLKEHLVDNYCPSKGNDSSTRHIDSVSIGSIQNQSGDNSGYGHFVGMVHQVGLGHKFNYYFAPKYNSFDVDWDLWCDFNGDYDFDDPGELIETIEAEMPVSGEVVIPVDAVTGPTRFRVVMSSRSSTVSTGSYSFGETEDYTIDIQPTSAVNDLNIFDFTPLDTCGVSQSEVGAEVIVQNLGTANLTTADIDFKIDGNVVSTYAWSGNLAFGEKDTFEIAKVNTAPGFRNLCISGKMPNGQPDEYIANDTLLKEHFMDVYCPSVGGNTNFLHIRSVNMNTGEIQNTSEDDDGYGNFTNMVFSGELGSTIDYSFQSDGFFIYDDQYWKLWCDINQDGDFDDQGELVGTKQISSPYVSGSFQIPANASLGQTRFRIVLSYHATTGSTGTYSYGETEDYTINIEPSPYVNNLNIFKFTPLDTCAVAQVEIGAEVILENLGSANLTSADIDFKIDAVTVSSLAWTGNLAFGEKDTIQFAKVNSTAGLHDLCIVGKMPNGQPDESMSDDSICTALELYHYCPCMSEDSDRYHIDTVTIGSIQNNSGDNGGYGDFTGMVHQVERGQVVNFRFVPDARSRRVTWGLWCDYNKDYDFDDPGEFIGSEYSLNPINGSFEIPSDAAIGQTRFRVVMNYYSASQGSILHGPAGIYPTGETEDYTIDITSSCPSDLTINDDPIISGLYEASDHIISSGGHVDNMGNVTFQANDYVHLENGFTVDMGGVFEVIIGGACILVVPENDEGF